MKISMLLATLNRHELMLRAIDSILSQKFKDFEIIIIDQSDYANYEVEKIDSRIKYVHIEEKGLSHARNVGLKYVTGEIIGLMDDDAIYTNNVLDEINKLFSSDEELGLVSGIVVDKSTNKISLRGMDIKRKEIDFGNIFKCCISPSMFIRKSIFDDEVFDEEFGLGCFWGSAEETDIALKVIYKNYRTVFCPDIVVYHPSCSKKDLPFKKLESYSRGFGAVCAKHFYLYHNKTMRFLYNKALFRAVGGYLLSLLKFSSHMCKYYKLSIKAKTEGYKTFKQHFRGDK